MQTKHLILPALAVGLGALLLVPAQDAGAFTLLGGSLSQSQRDFRVFNNFTDSTANDNTTPDPSFPGYQGAVVAIWKASVEWGSELHGDGSGDPHQPNGLGSGGANFDASFQGLATSEGTTNSNVHSELSGSSGGVLAFTETPISDGWRIKYYSGWTWDDGPDTNIGSRIDIQGVACHEYGHALGLDHSTATGATMQPAISGSGVTQRSISSDDIAGVQAVYGVKAGNKPRITGVTVVGNQITITGANFASTSNQVWFTQGSSGGTGTPIKVTNLTSTNGGTQLVCNVPSTAGPGDVLVRNDGTANDDLSNAWPTDLQPSGPTCLSPSNYCVSSPNSVGSGAVIDSVGLPSVAANDFTLACYGVPPNQFGIFFYGGSQVSSAFGDGILCVASGGLGVYRFSPKQADAFGDVSMPVNWGAAPVASGSGQWASGTQWFVQFWYRDPAAGGSGFNLSDALDMTICP
ncbi:MAG: matrixin family metalloprotease [Planctomycetes bacterium]|nr:matrixin family metalloprotease [Planctomycetota bacterium]